MKQILQDVNDRQAAQQKSPQYSCCSKSSDSFNMAHMCWKSISPHRLCLSNWEKKISWELSNTEHHLLIACLRNRFGKWGVSTDIFKHAQCSSGVSLPTDKPIPSTYWILILSHSNKTTVLNYTCWNKMQRFSKATTLSDISIHLLFSILDFFSQLSLSSF